LRRIPRSDLRSPQIRRSALRTLGDSGGHAVPILPSGTFMPELFAILEFRADYRRSGH
jgi:hypothetical protein